MSGANKTEGRHFEVRVEFKEGVDPVIAKVTAEIVKKAVEDNIHVKDAYLCELTERLVSTDDCRWSDEVE